MMLCLISTSIMLNEAPIWAHVLMVVPGSCLQSEYPPKCHERRHFISNFTGSAGVAVITSDRAALWTDGRYFLQVQQVICLH